MISAPNFKGGNKLQVFSIIELYEKLGEVVHSEKRRRKNSLLDDKKKKTKEGSIEKKPLDPHPLLSFISRARYSLTCTPVYSNQWFDRCDAHANYNWLSIRNHKTM